MPRYGNSRAARRNTSRACFSGNTVRGMGFNYIGPIDGHDVKAMVSTLRNLQKLRGPSSCTVVTRKGKGYAPREADPSSGMVRAVRSASGMIFKEAAPDDLFAIFGNGSATWRSSDPASSNHPGDARRVRPGEFSSDFPNATTTSRSPSNTGHVRGGTCAEGLKPVVAIIRPSARAYDQLIHDVALQNLPVIFRDRQSRALGSDGRPIRAATT